MIKARDKIYNEAHDNNKRREHERGLAKHRAREIAKKKREERGNKMRRQSVATKKGEKDFSFNDVVKQASKPAKLKTRGRQLSISGRNLERINQKFMMDQQKRQRTMDELHDESKQKALSRRELRRQKMRAKGLLKSQHKNKGMADVVTRKQSMGRDSAGVETGNSKSGGNSLDFARIVKTSKTVTRARSKIKGSAAADLVAERLKQRKKEEQRVHRRRLDEERTDKIDSQDDLKARLNKSLYMATVLLMLTYMYSCEKSSEVWHCDALMDGTTRLRMAPTVVCDFYHSKFVTLKKENCDLQIERSKPYLKVHEDDVGCAVSEANFETTFTQFGYFPENT